MSTESTINEWHALIASFRRRLPSRAAIIEAMKANPELACDAMSAISSGISASFTPTAEATMSSVYTTATDKWQAIVAEYKKRLPNDKAMAAAAKAHPQLRLEMLAEVNAHRRGY